MTIKIRAILAVLATVMIATPADPGLELDRSSSEIRTTIERYTVDRDSLLRRYQVEVSPTPRQRLASFAGIQHPD